MKISRNWLQTFFETPLPSTEVLAESLTFHAFEIDGIEKIAKDDVLDVKVTPNRGHDCLSHYGIAKELSAILQIPLSHDPLAHPAPTFEETKAVRISIENSTLCNRYIATYIKAVAVGPSPSWLSERLEAIGQRSINNIVDATNYVMFHLGQPLHAFDAAKLLQKDDAYAISVRLAKAGEKMLALDGKEYVFNDSTLLIVDDAKKEAIGIAGVKGGMPSGITNQTKDIIIESANFDGVSTRKTAQGLKLRTDASQRFEQVISPDLASYGLREVLGLITQIAGGEVVGSVDVYPQPQGKREVSVSVDQVQNLLGKTIGEKEIIDSFNRLAFVYKQQGGQFTVQVPFERLDICIAEDLIEEVGRIQGYDKIPAIQLSPLGSAQGGPEINTHFYWSENIRERLVSQGFSEVLTSVFSDAGERTVLNKVDGIRPYLRSSLLPGLQDAFERNVRNKELLGLTRVQLFEIGTVWKKGKEELMLGTIEEGGKANELLLADAAKDISEAKNYEYLSLSTTERYQPFSKFPHIVRDIAMWVPLTTSDDDVNRIIATVLKRETLGLSTYIRLFDQFPKDQRISLAFRIIFQSFERTLTDEEVNVIMEKVYKEMQERGFEIR